MLKFHVMTEMTLHPGGLFSERHNQNFKDLPAFESRDASGRLHNDYGPAIEFEDGRKIWYLHGKVCEGPEHEIAIRHLDLIKRLQE